MRSNGKGERKKIYIKRKRDNAYESWRGKGWMGGGGLRTKRNKVKYAPMLSSLGNLTLNMNREGQGGLNPD